MESKNNNYLNFLFNKKNFKVSSNKISDDSANNQDFYYDELPPIHIATPTPIYAPKPISLLLPVIFRPSSPELESRTPSPELESRIPSPELESRTPSPELESRIPSPELEFERLKPIIKSKTESPFLDDTIIDKNIERIDNFYKFSNGQFIWFQNNPIYVVPTEYFVNKFQISIFYLLNKQFEKTYGYIINDEFIECIL
jgi:hypothetical protein